MLCVDVLIGAFLISRNPLPKVWLAPTGTMELFHAVCSAMVRQLLAFHVGFQQEGLTTYKCIVRGNDARGYMERKRGEGGIGGGKWIRKRGLREEVFPQVGRLPHGDLCGLRQQGLPMEV